MFEEPTLKAVTVIIVAMFPLVACSNSEHDRIKDTTHATYDKTTGKLTMLTYDMNKDGKIDTWTYMDGTTPIRSEIDSDEDGKIDRWEYNTPDGKIDHEAYSERHTGVPDTWVWKDAAGRPRRMEYSSATTGKVYRWEFYENGKLVRVEEDDDGDGKVDKGELHDGDAITSVEFDTKPHRDGVANLRQTFGPGGQIVKTEMLGRGR